MGAFFWKHRKHKTKKAHNKTKHQQHALRPAEAASQQTKTQVQKIQNVTGL